MNNKYFSNNTFKFLTFLAFLVLCYFLSQRFDITLDQIRSFMQQFPFVLSGVIFVLLYSSLTILIWLGPKDVLRIAGAILFGAYHSTVLIWIGELINLTAMFYLSRKLGRGFVEEKFKLKSDDAERIQTHASLWGMMALRINPIFPFRLLDLGYGLTSVPFKKYFWVAVFISPLRIFWLQSIIAGVGEVILQRPTALITYLFENQSVLQYSLGYFLLVGLLTLVAFVFRLIKR